MILDSFLNVFTEADGSHSPADGLWRISHPNVVFAKLREICTANGWSFEWEVDHVNFHPVDGRTIVVGSLTVFDVANRTYSVTVPGTATGQTIDNDVAGVTTSAFVNACLRGLCMAEFAYALPKGAITQAPPVQHQAPPAPMPMQPSYQGGMAPPNPPNRPQYQQRPQSGGYGGGAPRRSFEWDGELTIKSGNYAGTKYKDMPIEMLQKWTSGADPNKSAVKELERRMKSGGGVPSVNAGFQGNGYAGQDSGVPQLDEVPY